MSRRALVCGAGGFIGGHLVGELLKRGDLVVACDIKPINEWWQVHPAALNVCGDLRDLATCRRVVSGADLVFHLAARMGGIGEIETHRCDCAMNSVITAHMLRASCEGGVQRFFFSSSACAYAAAKQDRADLPALKESDAYPAMPEAGYGWSKLFDELLCQYWMEDYGLECRVARFHNSFGPHGSYVGGKEKAPAAICRKIAVAQLTGKHEITIWGDGTRTRSFMWIGDNIEGICRIMESDIREPINLGSSECVTINELVSVVENVAGIKVTRHYDESKPQGVYGRNSDNTMIKARLGWEPSTPLVNGIQRTYEWIHEQVRQHGIID